MSRREEYWRARASSGPSSRNNRGDQSKEDEEQPDTTPRSYGSLLFEYERAQLREELCDPKISHCKYVASYNWLKGNTIMVPGKPPAWIPPAINRQLEPDEDDLPRDQNTARYKTYPMEPAVQAVLEQNPKFHTEKIDIFTSAIVLSNLSRFVRGVEREFRFDIERVGNTVFFIHREKYLMEPIPNVYHSFSHTFPKEYTSWEDDVQGSEFHQRIIQYRLGGLRLLVRIGVDGYFREEETLGTNSASDSLSDSSGEESFSRAVGNLQVQEGGEPIPQENIFIIKTRTRFDHQTRAIRTELDLTDIIPRLWVTQIPNLIVGLHGHGLFDDRSISVKDLRSEVAEWEARNKECIKQLVWLLQRLLHLGRKSSTSLEVRRSSAGHLQIIRLADEPLCVLPPDLKTRWVANEAWMEALLEDYEWGTIGEVFD